MTAPDLWSGPIPPTWYIPLCQPGQEHKASEFLRSIGVIECWYPTGPVWEPAEQARRKKVQRRVTIAPGYLFALVDRQPAWSVWLDHPASHLSGVLTHMAEIRVFGGRMEAAVPYEISPAEIAEMADVPDRLLDMQAEATRKAQEATEIRPGMAARFKDPLLSDYAVDVQEVSGDLAKFLFKHMPTRTLHETNIGNLERVR